MGPRSNDEQTFSLFLAFAPFSPRRWRKQARKYRALAAYLHLLLPAFSHGALTDGPVDEPAQMSCLKFPCGALLPDLLGASLHYPTGSGSFVLRRLERHKKKGLALDIRRDIPPSLLEALYGLEGGAQRAGPFAFAFFLNRGESEKTLSCSRGTLRFVYGNFRPNGSSARLKMNLS